nr:MAG TPA: hypothetical protein [Caudoviricetes sp.]
MNWKQYGTGDGGYTVEQVEAVARSLEEQELQEYSKLEAIRDGRRWIHCRTGGSRRPFP